MQLPGEDFIFTGTQWLPSYTLDTQTFRKTKKGNLIVTATKVIQDISGSGFRKTEKKLLCLPKKW